MRLIKPSFEVLDQQCGLEGVYKQIERVSRVCYKSEDKITEDSAKTFVDRMIKSGHGAMLEHGTVYLKIENNSTILYKNYLDIIYRYSENPYSKVNTSSTNSIYYITSNLRVLVENGWLDDLKYICEPTEYHEKRITVRFVCDRGVSHEFVRHRVFSFAQESTRYCNYSKDKFGNEITFIIPNWMDFLDVENVPLYLTNQEYNMSLGGIYFVNALSQCESCYKSLVQNGMKPQEARAVLPNALKTELVMTGFVSDWDHFFNLRCAESAHPQARELAIPLKEEFIKRKYV